jgi:hyperosmotically inducible protein
MKIKLATSMFVIGTVLAPLAVDVHAADSDMDRSHPKAFVKDSVITTKIKSKLAAEHLGSLKHIRIDTDKNGVVWMTGTANSQDAIDQAVTIARNTEGVRSVQADLKVKADR